MSSFMNNGARQQKVFENKKTKKHIKAFYKIMGDMDEVAKGLLSTHSEVEFTEENINEYVNPIYGRDLDSMEKFLVLGKLYHGRENR